MNIINDAYIIEWDIGQFVVTHNDCRGEYDRQFLSTCGSDFEQQSQVEVFGLKSVPLFDSIIDAEAAWDNYKILRDKYIIVLANRRKTVKKLV